MKATELRIGNWICFMDEVGESPLYIETEVNLMEIQQAIKYPDFFYGIPLTEKLLIRFGFNVDDNGSYWIDLQTHYLVLIPSEGYFYPVYYEIREFSGEMEQRVSIQRFQYVHQLQNLYFALTGEELKLNEL